MLTTFFVFEGTNFSANQIEVDGDEAHHGVNVLRLKKSEEVKISDGAGNWATGKVIELSKKSFTVEISTRGFDPAPKQRVIAVQAILKNDANKEAIDFLTQFGIDEIIPWQSQHSIGKIDNKSLSKWQSAARESSRQSRRTRIPVIANTLSTENLISKIKDCENVFVLHEAAENRLSQIEINEEVDVFLIVGPEGGLSEFEVNSFIAVGAKAVRLGESVLRAANAGAAATSVVMSRTGKW
jgi:16S rRNA (uracil1498-N3)-methyltransferase